MKTVNDLQKQRRLVSMHIGGSGVGKTHLAATYPKCYFIITEPNSEETWMNKPDLRKNIIAFEHFIPDKDNLKDMFLNITKEIQTVKDMQAKGEVETLVIDNLTYLIHNRWLWQSHYEIKKTMKNETDTRGMYGNLRTWCYNFMLMNIMSFKGNIVVNVHEAQENDEALEKKVDKSMVIVPNIIGGFRNDIDGLFSNVFYLNKLPQGKGVYKYIVRTNKGNGKNAKNRFGLPEVIEGVNYDTIIKAIRANEEVK